MGRKTDTHFVPSFLESYGTLRRGEQYLPGPKAKGHAGCSKWQVCTGAPVHYEQTVRRYLRVDNVYVRRQARLVGPGIYRPPRHPPHIEPSCLGLNGVQYLNCHPAMLRANIGQALRPMRDTASVCASVCDARTCKHYRAGPKYDEASVYGYTSTRRANSPQRTSGQHRDEDAGTPVDDERTVREEVAASVYGYTDTRE